jgi:hypothetical protein
MSSQRKKRICQYPVLENPDGVCGVKLAGRKLKWCDDHAIIVRSFRNERSADDLRNYRIRNHRIQPIFDSIVHFPQWLKERYHIQMVWRSVFPRHVFETEEMEYALGVNMKDKGPFPVLETGPHNVFKLFSYLKLITKTDLVAHLFIAGFDRGWIKDPIDPLGLDDKRFQLELYAKDGRREWYAVDVMKEIILTRVCGEPCSQSELICSDPFGLFICSGLILPRSWLLAQNSYGEFNCFSHLELDLNFLEIEAISFNPIYISRRKVKYLDDLLKVRSEYSNALSSGGKQTLKFNLGLEKLFLERSRIEREEYYEEAAKIIARSFGVDVFKIQTPDGSKVFLVKVK